MAVGHRPLTLLVGKRCSSFVAHRTRPLPSCPFQAGSPIPSYSTSQCCATVINGCGVALNASGTTISLSSSSTSALSGSPDIVWNGIASPNSIPLVGAGGSVLASANGNYFLSVSGASGRV